MTDTTELRCACGCNRTAADFRQAYPLLVRIVKVNPYNLPVGKTFYARHKEGDASPYPIELGGNWPAYFHGRIYQMKLDEVTVEADYMTRTYAKGAGTVPLEWSPDQPTDVAMALAAKAMTVALSRSHYPHQERLNFIARALDAAGVRGMVEALEEIANTVAYNDQPQLANNHAAVIARAALAAVRKQP